MSAKAQDPAPLKRTPLHDLHVAAGARMVPFAGYDMPVQYPMGVLKEHVWTREKAGLFDVSHMGQASMVAEDGEHDTVARALETLVPADIAGLKPGQQRYTQLLTDDGGIFDDLMVARPADPNLGGWLSLVVNAARKDADYAHISGRLPRGVRLETGFGYSGLIALQGPAAAAVLAEACPETTGMAFMTTLEARLYGKRVQVSRAGYTGEDGFEIAVGRTDAPLVWSALCRDARVTPVGLGARDSLRLEAGLCLYGHDIDETTSPIEADLAWSIQKRRRETGGFPGDQRILAELTQGPARKRIGIKPEGRAPAREGTEILAGDGTTIGTVTSGGFGPSVDAPIAMGYVAAAHSSSGTPVQLMVRGKPLPARVAPLPFVPHRYHRKPK